MSRLLLIFLVVSGLSVLNCSSQVVNSDNRLRMTVMMHGQAEVTIPYSSINNIDLLTTNVSILSVKDKVVYIRLSPLTVEWFIQQKFNYQLLEQPVIKNVPVFTKELPMQWDKYPTYSQYDSIMHIFLNLYPSLCHLDTIGTSVNGKLVLALRISGSADVKPAVFYTSTMHGDEIGGFVLMLHLADYLLKNYGVSSRVKSLLDNLEIWINPLANPDGTYNTGNTISSPVRFNANGFDLNRNFPDPIDPNTIKQKETLDMIKFMRKRKFVLSANFHSGSEVVNYPWDRWLSKLHADDTWFNSISRSYADTAHVYAGAAYMNMLDDGVTRGALWYIIYGGRQDFMTWELHGREVTIELDDQFITPEAQLLLLWQNNWHSLIGYLENALHGIHGHVENAITHVPVPAKVFIEGYDKDSSQVYSDTLTGNFVRFLSPGSWDLTFSATGYISVTKTSVVVSPGQRTDLVVDMSPIVSSIDSEKNTSRLILYPNPAKSLINALLPDTISGNVNIRIINYSGMVISDYNIEIIQGSPLTIDLKKMSEGIYSIVFTNTGNRSSIQGRFLVIK
ncbi:MAG TPA: M14 family zinc carboxypeptidase [Bacteroidales bacterium]|nr:M14 family zinc carboxypeptidase [Bacteroidales bacterium]